MNLKNLFKYATTLSWCLIIIYVDVDWTGVRQLVPVANNELKINRTEKKGERRREWNFSANAINRRGSPSNLCESVDTPTIWGLCILSCHVCSVALTLLLLLFYNSRKDLNRKTLRRVLTLKGLAGPSQGTDAECRRAYTTRKGKRVSPTRETLQFGLSTPPRCLLFFFTFLRPSL